MTELLTNYGKYNILLFAYNYNINNHVIFNISILLGIIVDVSECLKKHEK